MNTDLFLISNKGILGLTNGVNYTDISGTPI